MRSAVLGVEAVARHEHQAGEEAVEGVAAHEQAQPLALAEVQDPHAIRNSSSTEIWNSSSRG